MSVKPGTTSKRTIAAANGLGSIDAPSTTKTGVGSETMNFRTPYSGQEADSPAIKEASGDANRAA